MVVFFVMLFLVVIFGLADSLGLLGSGFLTYKYRSSVCSSFDITSLKVYTPANDLSL